MLDLFNHEVAIVEPARPAGREREVLFADYEGLLEGRLLNVTVLHERRSGALVPVYR